MKHRGVDVFSGIRLKVLLVRILLGVLFGFMLMNLFFPGAGVPALMLTVALLVFFAYLFESVRKDGS